MFQRFLANPARTEAAYGHGKCRALLAVLEAGSLSAAAEKLDYTPSGLSRMMAALSRSWASRCCAARTTACSRRVPAGRCCRRCGN
ncbi:MAG: LysR family transcriptional regulator [Oscillospiraceae bacterium]